MVELRRAWLEIVDEGDDVKHEGWVVDVGADRWIFYGRPCFNYEREAQLAADSDVPKLLKS
jgi:hypothetical protein